MVYTMDILCILQETVSLLYQHGGNKAVMPTPQGTRPPHSIRVRGPDLWYHMVLVDTMVKQSLVPSAGGTRGRECM